MTLHAFIDESYRGEYILCAAILDSGHVAAARRVMISQLRTGQARIHMAKENDGRRRSLLNTIAALETSAHMIAVQVKGRSVRSSRDAAFTELTAQLVELGVSRAIIESCDQDQRDKQVIGDSLARLRALGSLEIHHLRPHDEPLLWIPDAIAWAFGKGTAEWRAHVDPMIKQVIHL